MPIRLSGDRVDEVDELTADDAGVVAQQHPDQSGDLVIATATGAELAADLGPGPLDQPALERAVHVLIRRRGDELPLDATSASSRSRAASMAVSSSVVR